MNNLIKLYDFMRNIFLLLFFVVGSVYSQNPIIKDNFTADPTARVFEGKVYLYPSHDIKSSLPDFKDWFCMEDYHVYSSENLVDWTDHGVILSQDDVPWIKPKCYTMWAPDCVHKDGKYYFFFPSLLNKEEREFGVGIAVSDTPYGPFSVDSVPIKGISGKDPCVFIDDDGEAYIYVSAGGLHVAKLNKNMREADSKRIFIEGLPEGFKEGPFVFKKNGKYYLTYPWNRKTTQTLAYAIGDTPFGPFEHKGVIMDETECWTNHHSLVEYKDQWYLFYQTNQYSPKFDVNRSVRIDSLFFNQDGTIRKVIPTLRGVGLSDARKKIQIDRYSEKSPDGVKILFVNENNKFDGWKSVFSKKGAWLKYNNVDFGELPVKDVKIRVSSESGGRMKLCASDNIIAYINIPGHNDWNIITVPIISENVPTGIHDISLSLLDGNNIEVDWISFL